MQGSIASYLPSKRYGFIKGDDDRDYFFHVQDVVDQSRTSGLYDGARVHFEPVATPKGYKAKALVVDTVNSATDTYVTPNEVVTSRTDQVRGWEVLERSDWLIQASSRFGVEAARAEALGQARRIGANGLIELQYFKSTGAEPGTGTGVHHFTVHNVRGRAVVLGKRHMAGQRLQHLVGINAKAQAYSQQLNDVAQSKKVYKRWWWLVALIVLLGVLSTSVREQVIGLIPLAGFLYLIVWMNKRYYRKYASPENPLVYSPTGSDE